VVAELKALSDPTRLRLVGILANGEFTVQDLVSILEMGQSRISRHLKIMVDAELCTVRHQGTWSYFQLNGQSRFFHTIRQPVLESMVNIDGFEQDQAGVARILNDRMQKSRQFFDQHARHWDELAADLVPVERYMEAILTEVDKADTVVDVGVGTGRLLTALSSRSAQVIGVDHSSPMLDEAKARIDRDGLGNIELRLGEMSHLPLADSSADCAIVNMVLHHAANPQTVFSELSRVVKNGGKVVIADLLEHDLDWFRERMADQWMGFSRAEVKQWLSAAGFKLLKESQYELNQNLPSVFVMTAEKYN